jgi:hypothetical protein
MPGGNSKPWLTDPRTWPKQVAEVSAFGERGPAVSATELLVTESTELLIVTWNVPIDVEAPAPNSTPGVVYARWWLPELQKRSRSTGN